MNVLFYTIIQYDIIYILSCHMLYADYQIECKIMNYHPTSFDNSVTGLAIFLKPTLEVGDPTLAQSIYKLDPRQVILSLAWWCGRLIWPHPGALNFRLRLGEDFLLFNFLFGKVYSDKKVLFQPKYHSLVHPFSNVRLCRVWQDICRLVAELLLLSRTGLWIFAFRFEIFPYYNTFLSTWWSPRVDAVPPSLHLTFASEHSQPHRLWRFREFPRAWCWRFTNYHTLHLERATDKW